MGSSMLTGESILITALWGLIGGLAYAVPRLATVYWGASEATSNGRKLAWVEFVLNMLTSPSVAVTMSGAVTEWFAGKFPHAAVAIALGYGSTALVKRLSGELEKRVVAKAAGEGR